VKPPKLKTPGAEDTRRGTKRPKADPPTKADPVNKNVAPDTTEARPSSRLLVAECQSGRILAKKLASDLRGHRENFKRANVATRFVHSF